MKSLLRAALLVLASLLANHAHAAACAAGTVASIANTSCTIGDLLFTFGAASIRDDSHLSGVTTAALTFTPNVGVGTEGFTVTGSFTETAGEGELDWFGVGFSTLSSLKTVIGVTATTTSTSNGIGAHIPFAEFNETEVGNGTNGASAQPGIGACSGLITCGQDFTKGNVASATGQALALGAVTGNGGSVTSSATQFIVREVPVVAAVPEPSEWALMLGGLGLLVTLAKRRSDSRRD